MHLLGFHIREIALHMSNGCMCPHLYLASQQWARVPCAGMPAYSVPVPLQAYFLGTPHAQHPGVAGTLTLDLWQIRKRIFHSLGLVRILPLSVAIRIAQCDMRDACNKAAG